MPVPSRLPTQRFSDRVDFYLRYRPRYPRALTEHLAAEGVLSADSIVADVGCGTGFLAEVFLCQGCTVHGIEPNANMRAAADAVLAPYPRFHNHDAAAEATGLPDASVDWVVAGQAFHWFDTAAAAVEFRRILRPDGRAGIVWNDRDAQGTPFLRDYDALVRTHAPEYKDTKHRNVGEAEYRAFFGHTDWKEATFPHTQAFDREGLRGRLLSSSYAPAPGTPGHDPMVAALDELFDRYQRDGSVEFAYVARIVWGPLR